MLNSLPAFSEFEPGPFILEAAFASCRFVEITRDALVMHE
jgi:hypothetical protein